MFVSTWKTTAKYFHQNISWKYYLSKASLFNLANVFSFIPSNLMEGSKIT